LKVLLQYWFKLIYLRSIAKQVIPTYINHSRPLIPDGIHLSFFWTRFERYITISGRKCCCLRPGDWFTPAVRCSRGGVLRKPRSPLLAGPWPRGSRQRLWEPGCPGRGWVSPWPAGGEAHQGRHHHGVGTATVARHVTITALWNTNQTNI